MPVIKSAKKKLRQDRKREFQNEGIRKNLKSLIKKAAIEKSDKAVREAVSAADKAAKKYIIHANKAARIKSALAALLMKKKDLKSTTSKPATAA